MAFHTFRRPGNSSFFCPGLADVLTKSEGAVRTTGGILFVGSFVLANFTVFRRLRDRVAEFEAIEADIHVEIKEHHFNPSRGGRRPFGREIPPSEYGFNEQGVPDWGSLYARIRYANVGYKKGKFVVETDQTEFPGLFDREKVRWSWNGPPPEIDGQKETWRELFLDLPFTQRDPQAFALELKDLVQSQKRYKVVIRYRTRRLIGESDIREVCIEGDFCGFYQGVVRTWHSRRFKELVELAQLDDQ